MNTMKITLTSEPQQINTAAGCRVQSLNGQKFRWCRGDPAEVSGFFRDSDVWISNSTNIWVWVPVGRMDVAVGD